MRYIYYIILIFLGLSALIGYELRSQYGPTKDMALMINDRVITTDEFDKLFSSRPSDVKDKEDFINSLITKELLIQESQKEGINKEESFRKSIQNYYEQSLIKSLMDRKLASLRITVSEDELNKCFGFFNKKVHLTIFSYGTEEEARKGNYKDGETKVLYFDDIAKDMRNKITALKEGEFTEPIKTDENKYVVVRLDRIETCPSGALTAAEKDRLKKMLIEEKKEKALTDWVNGLRQKANIKIFIDKKK